MSSNPKQKGENLSQKSQAGKPVIGWREYVSLPDWGIDRVRVKTDTGARTSAIHVAEYDELEDGTARFEVVISERPKMRTVFVEAPLVREAIVKPSSGKRQRRPVVKTTLRLGGIEKEIEITLVCRKGMLCRMLLGRTAIGNSFVVDASRKYLASEQSIKKSEQRRNAGAITKKEL